MDIRTLHLNTERGMRGGEVQCLGLMRLLSEHGHRCELAAPPRAPLSREAADSGIPTHPWEPRGEWDLRAARQVRGLLEGEDPVVLHAHTAHALTPAILAARGREGVKVVATRRVSFPLRSPFSRIKYGRADAVVAVSGSIAQELEAAGLSPARLTVIHSGTDPSRWEGGSDRKEARRTLGVAPGAFLFALVGALVAHKGHGVFFEALGRLEAPPGRIQVLLAGEGSLRAELEEKARAMGDAVRFLGYVPDPRPLYAAADCVVLPSLSGEGSPGVVKEAAASGVPVVASDVGGVSEILRPGKEALLVPPGDVSALAEALKRVLDGEGSIRAMTLSARERVGFFTMERMAEAYEALYRRLLTRVPS